MEIYLDEDPWVEDLGGFLQQGRELQGQTKTVTLVVRPHMGRKGRL